MVQGTRRVTLDGFERYVAASPEYFGHLVMWREVFGRYAGQDGEIGEADAVKLVKDIMTLNKQNFDEATAQAHAQQLFRDADVSNDGAISWPEFVKYASENKQLFQGVAAAVMSPHASPRKRQLELDLIKLAREHFRKADADTSGTLDRQELKSVVRELAQANQMPQGVLARSEEHTSELQSP